MQNAVTPSCVVVGGGDWGKNILRTLHELGALAGLVEKDSACAQRHVQTFGLKIFSWEEALASSEVQGILLATPAKTHMELGLQALNANKHIFIEKPITQKVFDAEVLLKKAQERQRFIMPGHLMRYHPDFQILEQFIKDGKLGDILFIQSRRSNFGKFFEDVDVLSDLGPHDLSMILALLPNILKKTSPIIHTFPNIQRAHGIDHLTTHLTWEQDRHLLRTEMTLNRLSSVKEQRLNLLGTRGLASFDDTAPAGQKIKIVLFDSPFDTLNPGQSTETYLKGQSISPLTAEMKSFLEGIQSPASLTAFEEAIDVMRILEQIEQAI